jgi:hypothetical protein
MCRGVDEKLMDGALKYRARIFLDDSQNTLGVICVLAFKRKEMLLDKKAPVILQWTIDE